MGLDIGVIRNHLNHGGAFIEVYRLYIVSRRPDFAALSGRLYVPHGAVGGGKRNAAAVVDDCLLIGIYRHFLAERIVEENDGRNVRNGIVFVVPDALYIKLFRGQPQLDLLSRGGRVGNDFLVELSDKRKVFTVSTNCITGSFLVPK